ncbi:MAG: tetratricopeptide repeat protein [Steroidobacteraceae bacterium]
MTTSEAAGQVESALRHARSLHRAGRLDEARALCLEALELQPRQPEALTLLGIIAAQTGDLERAVALFDQVLRLDPRSFAAHNNRGNALLALKHPAAAVASYEAAIAIAPDHAPTYFGRARALIGMMQYEAAIATLEKVIALEPDHAGAWYLRANARYSLGQFAAALASFDRAIALRPDDARAYHNRGNALCMLERPEEAVASYDKALALDPNMRSTPGARLHARMHLADWRDFTAEVARLTARIEHDEAASNPFVVLALCGSPQLQRRAAQNWVRERCPPNGALPALPASGRRERLRVGYFSAEFHGHATASLTAELFETHDRSRLELTAFSLGPDTKEAMRARLEAAFDRFLDVRAKSDEDIARLARSFGIDIAVDLGGFTRGGRPGIFALRAAPVQVSYLGYLGTMSADYMDYLIADDTIIPATHRRHYSERIVYLPSYQVNDSKRRIAEQRFGREELGLPPAGFVFCCFNSTYKITPGTFDRWMRILRRAPGSVLFLLGGSATLEGNLRREAQARGIDSHRIVFGARLPAPEYLARYRAADLFLDTLPYNAGTTASDALWAGLPVLTCMGEAFAGRIGASVLQSVGLPELITATSEQYEALAVELAGNPVLLAGIRAKLAGELRAAPLFNTAAFARHLEAAFARMDERYRAGLAPEHIRVDD